MVKSLCVTLVYCPGLTCIQEGYQYHSLVDFKLGVKVPCHPKTFALSLPEVTRAFAIVAVMYTVLERVLHR